MDCYQIGTAIVCAPDSYPWRGMVHCPTCDRRRRFAGYDQAWYGLEMLPRPFKRGWRERSKAKAREWWVRAEGMRAGHRAWLRQQVEVDGHG